MGSRILFGNTQVYVLGLSNRLSKGDKHVNRYGRDRGAQSRGSSTDASSVSRHVARGRKG
jgi:hypothetical protein